MVVRILALDLATNFGWALGSPEDGVLQSGSHRLGKTGEDVGLFLHQFRTWLTDAIAGKTPDAIAFEQPVLPDARKTSITTLRKLYSLAGLTELIAHDAKIDCVEANTSDICTHFLGKGFPRKRDPRKKATIAKCRERGWRVSDDNHADALALLDFILSRQRPELALESTPLFSTRAA